MSGDVGEMSLRNACVDFRSHLRGKETPGGKKGLSLRGTIQRSRDVVVDGASSHSHRDSSRSGSKCSLYSRVIARLELCSGFFFSFRSPRSIPKKRFLSRF